MGSVRRPGLLGKDDGTGGHRANECDGGVCPAPEKCTEGAFKAIDRCNGCSCSGGKWVCGPHSCPPVADCNEGDTKQADDCNTCTCVDGQWACTMRACFPPPVCTDGQTMPASDGCNTCSCSNGAWLCTTRNCQPPPPPPRKGCGGWLGNTCTADEYCAYTPGLLCGAADASATCQRRPIECPPMNAPVCACDGKQYPNACAAAHAGFGVNTDGPCP